LIEIRLAFLLRRRHHWALTYVELHRLIPYAEGRVVHLIHIRYSSNFPTASRWRGLISPLTLTSERRHCHIHVRHIGSFVSPTETKHLLIELRNSGTCTNLNPPVYKIDDGTTRVRS